MLQRVKHAKPRLLLAHLILAVHREFAEAIFETAMFGSNATDCLLVCAIVIGQLELRRMTSTKLADYAGIPRPTVIRRLRDLQQRGIVELDEDGRAGITSATLNHPRVIAAHQTVVSKICALSRRMSKTDYRPVATR